ncbi:histone acetyltransferase KAT6B-like isoform X2 [Acanthaster planci]|uniref:Histone acetyltransferase KAT6B-like isoform X2 n=1 Tax=Acanthaster planci TaxID=133434 RepID=A0A8B7Y3Y3_ACAPL|nr:histone acetyltransferase KAT6B-like isoform X2 [Acanthaster planci]
MGAKTNQEVILETIDSLRRRKARPDLERICHMVERKYGVSAAEVECELERLVDDEVVFKVEYKGSTSYRNASKWKQSHLSGIRLNSTDSSRLLLEAVEELSRAKDEASTSSAAARQDFKQGQAVQMEDIERHLLTLDPDTKLTIKMRLQNALDREVFSGRLVKVGKGTYALPPAGAAVERPTSGPAPVGTVFKTVDRIKKRKRIRKTHGPDFEHEPLCKQPSTDQRCDYCSYNASCNKFGDAEELLICKDCNLKVHPSCMRYSVELAERSRLSPWQCMDCKTCLVCNESGDAVSTVTSPASQDKLLFCDSCDKGYHMACHHPPVFKKPEGKWVCFTCERDEEMEYYSSDGSAVLSSNEDFYSVQSSPSESSTVPPVNDASREVSGSTPGKVSPDVATPCMSNAARLPEQSASSGSNRDYPLTDPVEWSIEDVVKYFADHGFPEQSAVFQEQEIDGKSLLLMKRLDVLTGLSLKLGPALKIYNHVMKLQLFCKHGCKGDSAAKAGKGPKGAGGSASTSTIKTAAKTSTSGTAQMK